VSRPTIVPLQWARATQTIPSDGEVTSILETELREIREGLIATVVGVGVDDFATNRLVERMSADPDALESVIRVSLSQSARMDALNSTGLMGADSQTMLDNVASLTAEALATPFAAVSLLDDDRQFLAGSSTALEAGERWRPVGLSICKYTVVSGIPFIVDDATAHPLLAAHPAVISGEVGAYAGVPLFSEDDQAVGTLYIWDNRPRRWTSGQIIVLQDMADLAAAKIFRRPI
jgi:GAF domain-containing protein